MLQVCKAFVRDSVTKIESVFFLVKLFLAVASLLWWNSGTC